MARERYFTFGALVISGLLMIMSISFWLFPKATPIVECHDPTVDFGTISAGGNPAHDFIVRNNGSGAARITGVTPDCGCVLIQTSNNEISPGSHVTIRLALSTAGQRGQVTKRAVVSFDHNLPSLVLSASARVQSGISVIPERFTVTRKLDQSLSGSSVILAQDSTRHSDFTVEDVNSIAPYLKVHSRRRDPPEMGYIVSVTPLPSTPFMPPPTKVVIRTNIAGSEEIVVPVEFAASR